jgi:hypothetical protein
MRTVGNEKLPSRERAIIQGLLVQDHRGDQATPSHANCSLLSVHCLGRLDAPWYSSRRKSTKALSGGRI